MLLSSGKHLSSLSSRATSALRPFRWSAAVSEQTRRFSLDDPSNKRRPTLVTGVEGVHQTMKTSKNWKNKPLFRRQGDVRFKTGSEAADLLVAEAMRRDSHETEYIESVTAHLQSLAPIFDRNPKYAFIAKALMEPERLIQFRVAWIDDVGVVRMNRGYRIQYSSTLGPYAGGLHFGSHLNNGTMKALGYDAIFTNAITGYAIGAAVGGSDFNPMDKSQAELQRFCQSYMTELSKYVGPDQDLPTMGMGVGQEEMGYMFGQYKRIKTSVSAGNFLSSRFPEAPGYGVVHLANELLQDKGESMKGKRCLILGSGKVARAVAKKLLDYGAVPLTFSDASGHVYEPNGISAGQLSTINKIKSDRGALLGRYIISSTTAEFNNPTNIFDIECDLCFPCSARNSVTPGVVESLANNGCIGVIEGGQSAVTDDARKTLKKRGLLYGPHNVTLTGSTIVQQLGVEATDEALQEEVARIYNDVKTTATEFNVRGDLFAGANIQGFLHVANVMITHGAV